MKTIIVALLALVLSFTQASAAQVTLEWDHEQNAGDKYVVTVDGVDQPETAEKTQTLNLAPGARTLVVRAVAANGLQSDRSAPLVVAVPNTPSNLRIKITITVEGVAKLRFKGSPGSIVSVEVSNDLQKWEALAMVLNQTGEFVLLDEHAMGRKARFWRGTEIQAS